MAAEPQDVRLRLRRKLEEMVGVEEADLLMDRPPGGWSSLVTKDWLHLELAALEVKFASRFDGNDERFTSIDQQFRSIDQQFRSIDQRLGSIDRRFERIDDRIDGVQQAINQQTWRLMIAMLTGMSILTAIVSFVAKA